MTEPATEKPALVLHPGDVVIVRSTEKRSMEEADHMRQKFAKHDVEAIVIDGGWDVVREGPRFVDTGMVDAQGYTLYRLEDAR